MSDTIEYWKISGTPESDYGRDAGRIRGRCYRTPDQALAVAMDWMRSHPEFLNVHYFEWEREKKQIASKHGVKWPVELVPETRPNMSTYEVRRYRSDDLDAQAIAEMEIRWLKRWKETSEAEVDGVKYSREDTKSVEIEPWQPWMHRESDWSDRKASPVYGTYYINIAHRVVTFEAQLESKR